MNWFIYPLTLLLSLTPFPDSDKDKKKGEDQYYKYEREDVSVFREQIDFRLPDPVPAEYREEAAAEFPAPVNLGPRFGQGNKVVIEANPQLQQLVERDRMLKQKIESLPGFRIHIYAGTARQQAWDTKRRALSAFPEIASYLDFQSPNYVVRIGDFLDRDEALLFLREARQFFPSAFLVNDEVSLPRPEDLDNEQDD